MRSQAVAVFLLAAIIFHLTEIDGGGSEASSYSNQNHDSSSGYFYPSKYTSNDSEDNEIFPPNTLNDLLERLRKENMKRLETNGYLSSIFNTIHTEEDDEEEDDDEDDDDDFSYDESDPYGPSRWGELAKTCYGKNQSPIAIHTDHVTVIENGKPFKIEGLDIMPEAIEITNSGHSLKLVFKYANNQKIKFSGGPLENDFYLDNIHFHWGGNNTHGSEHVINNRQYSAEVHFVTYNSVYDTMVKAVLEPNGLAVLGILYDYDRQFNGKDHSWIKFASKVHKAHSSYMEGRYVFPLREIVRDGEFRGLLSYRGSLTTPGCSENVLWMLSTRPIFIKQNELYELRLLRNAKGRRVLGNFRPLQETNGRIVTAYKF